MFFADVQCVMRSNKWMLMSCFCRKLCAADNSCVCSLLCQINAAGVFPGLFIVLEHWCLAGLDRGVSKQQIKGFAVILFWLGFIYLCTGLWGCLWITFSSWSGKFGMAGWKCWKWWLIIFWSMLKWRWEGIAPFHNKSSLRFRHSVDPHSGISWSDCQSFPVLPCRCSRGISAGSALGSSCIWPQEGHPWSLLPCTSQIAGFGKP